MNENEKSWKWKCDSLSFSLSSFTSASGEMFAMKEKGADFAAFSFCVSILPEESRKRPHGLEFIDSQNRTGGVKRREGEDEDKRVRGDTVAHSHVVCFLWFTGHRVSCAFSFSLFTKYWVCIISWSFLLCKNVEREVLMSGSLVQKRRRRVSCLELLVCCVCVVSLSLPSHVSRVCMCGLWYMNVWAAKQSVSPSFATAWGCVWIFAEKC